MPPSQQLPGFSALHSCLFPPSSFPLPPSSSWLGAPLSFATPGSERILFLEGLSQPACGMGVAALHGSHLCLAESSVSCLRKVVAHHSENMVAS